MTCGHKLVSAAEFWSRLQRCFLTLDVYKSWTEEVLTGKRQSTVWVSGAGTAAHFYRFSTWGMILNIQLKRPESSSWAGLHESVTWPQSCQTLHHQDGRHPINGWTLRLRLLQQMSEIWQHSLISQIYYALIVKKNPDSRSLMIIKKHNKIISWNIVCSSLKNI